MFAPGATVTLSAVPAEGYFFKRWTGAAASAGEAATATLKLGDGSTGREFVVGADFEEGLHFEVTSSEYGRISVNPKKAGYRVGETVEVSAAPNAGYLINDWSDGQGGKELVRTITMSGTPGTVTRIGANYVAGVRVDASRRESA